MTTTLQQLTAAQANKEVAINRNFETLSPMGMYGLKQSTTTGLTLGYYGGHIAGSAVADGTIALDASNTVYVVAHRTTGAVSKATNTTNWDATSTYGRLFKCTTSASAITPVDWRLQSGGWFDRTGVAGAVDASAVTYTPTTAADWDGAADPGDLDQALDQLAERTKDLETAGSGALPWFDVTAAPYNATGDGTTDDTTAIAAAITALNAAGGGVLYFPTGSYNTTGGFVLTEQCRVLGDGCADALAAVALSIIKCSSATAKLFDFQEHGSVVEKVHLTNTHGTPSAGTAIYTTAGNGFRMIDVSVDSFYDNIDIQDGAEWFASRVFSYGAFRYGWRVRHVDLPDGGDWTMGDCHIIANGRNATSALRIESGGGGKITNCKVNGRSTYKFVNAIDLDIASATGVLVIHGNSFENVTGAAIKMRRTSTGTWNNIVIAACQFGNYTTVNFQAIDIVGTATGQFDRLSITGCTFYTGSSSTKAINLEYIDNAILEGCVQSGYADMLSVANCGVVRNGMARYGVKVLTDAATIAIDNVNYENFAVTLTASRTLGTPTVMYSGQVLNFRIIQNGTGGWTLTREASMKTRGGASTIAIASAASASSLASMQYDGNTTTWFVADNSLAFS
jgi:hypothetical protein